MDQRSTSRYDDPLAKALAGVPEDDEPLTDDDLAAIAESDKDLAAGRIVALEDLKRDLGLPVTRCAAQREEPVVRPAMKYLERKENSSSTGR